MFCVVCRVSCDVLCIVFVFLVSTIMLLFVLRVVFCVLRAVCCVLLVVDFKNCMFCLLCDVFC